MPTNELIQPSLEDRKRFVDLANRLALAQDSKEQRRLKEELARMTFGS